MTQDNYRPALVTVQRVSKFVSVNRCGCSGHCSWRIILWRRNSCSFEDRTLRAVSALSGQEWIVRAPLFLRRKKTAQIGLDLVDTSGRRLDAMYFVEFLDQALISVADHRELCQEVDRHHRLTLFDTAHKPAERCEDFGRQRELLD